MSSIIISNVKIKAELFSFKKKISYVICMLNSQFPNTFLMSYLIEHLDTELCLKFKLPS